MYNTDNTVNVVNQTNLISETQNTENIQTCLPLPLSADILHFQQTHLILGKHKFCLLVVCRMIEKSFISSSSVFKVSSLTDSSELISLSIY